MLWPSWHVYFLCSGPRPGSTKENKSGSFFCYLQTPRWMSMQEKIQSKKYSLRRHRHLRVSVDYISGFNHRKPCSVMEASSLWEPRSSVSGPQDQDMRLVSRALPPLLRPRGLLSQDLAGSICIECPIHTRRHGLPQSPRLSLSSLCLVPGGPCSEINQSDRAAVNKCCWMEMAPHFQDLYVHLACHLGWYQCQL